MNRGSMGAVHVRAHSDCLFIRSPEERPARPEAMTAGSNVIDRSDVGAFRGYETRFGTALEYGSVRG